MRVSNAVLFVVGHGQGLGEALGLVVAAARADRIDVAPVFFGLGMHQRVAVDFGSRRQEEPGVFVFGQAQGFVRAQRTDLQRLDRQLEVINRAGRRGEMPDVIDRAVQEDELGHVLLDEFEIPIAAQVGDVVHAAGDEVVDADDLVAARQQQVGQMGAEEAGRAGDDAGGLSRGLRFRFCMSLIICLFSGELLSREWLRLRLRQVVWSIHPFFLSCEQNSQPCLQWA